MPQDIARIFEWGGILFGVLFGACLIGAICLLLRNKLRDAEGMSRGWIEDAQNDPRIEFHGPVIQFPIRKDH